jgi:hypothetical protein
MENTPNLGYRSLVDMSPSDRITQLHLQAPAFNFTAFFVSQGCYQPILIQVQGFRLTQHCFEYFIQ